MKLKTALNSIIVFTIIFVSILFILFINKKDVSLSKKVIDQNLKVSVIVPVYNTEDYLDKCLTSLINQTYKNLEIIIIDDASTDNSQSILKKYAENDNRIRLYINPQNIGVANIRNLAMQHVTGDYIYFIDSDDYIDLDFIENLVYAAKKYDADIVVTRNILFYFNNQKVSSMGYQLNEFSFVNSSKASDLRNMTIFVWNKLYKTSLIRKTNAYFLEDIRYSEEIFFNLILVNNTDKIVGINPKSYYIRNMRISSTSRNQTLEMEKNDLFKTIKYSRDYLKSNNLMEKNVLDIYNIFSLMQGMKYLNKEDQENFYKDIRMLMFEIKDDVLQNETIYSRKDLIIFNDILKYDNYKDFRKANRIYHFKIQLLIIFFIILIIIMTIIALKCYFDIINKYYNKIKK